MNNFIGIALLVIQLLAAVFLIFIIATQTTKSEQSGTGMGWGTIGGQASSSIGKYGREEQLTRITTITAIVFIVVSFITALYEAHVLIK